MGNHDGEPKFFPVYTEEPGAHSRTRSQGPGHSSADKYQQVPRALEVLNTAKEVPILASSTENPYSNTLK